jgi:hypothetical protein
LLPVVLEEITRVAVEELVALFMIVVFRYPNKHIQLLSAVAVVLEPMVVIQHLIR